MLICYKRTKLKRTRYARRMYERMSGDAEEEKRRGAEDDFNKDGENDDDVDNDDDADDDENIGSAVNRIEPDTIAHFIRMQIHWRSSSLSCFKLFFASLRIS